MQSNFTLQIVCVWSRINTLAYLYGMRVMNKNVSYHWHKYADKPLQFRSGANNGKNLNFFKHSRLFFQNIKLKKCFTIDIYLFIHFMQCLNWKCLNFTKNDTILQLNKFVFLNTNISFSFCNYVTLNLKDCCKKYMS